jgi:glycosyltransferase involved in cell wall biosynthesis
LDNKRFISQLLFQIAGKNALHVVLCKNMKNNLINKYACKHVITLSNIVLLHSVNSTSNRKKIRAIGYLSNITEEKGARDVIKLAEAIREHGLPIKFKVAGPCQDVQLKKALLDAHEKGIIDWLGPVYDEKKEDFWNSIDIFVFPTRYKNEAEPLVVWEAILAGIPVIAMDRGCISEQIGQAGSFLPSDADFVQFTLEQLADWNDNPENYLHLLNEIRQKQINIQTRADEQWKEFISYLEVENSLGNEIG